MELVKLSCSGCGGALEIPRNVRFAACTYCGSQLEIKHSNSACWSELHSQVQEHSEAIEILRLEQELTRCDLEWSRTRERHLVNGVEPSDGAADWMKLIGGLTIAGVAAFFLIVLIGSNWSGGRKYTYPPYTPGEKHWGRPPVSDQLPAAHESVRKRTEEARKKQESASRMFLVVLLLMVPGGLMITAMIANQNYQSFKAARDRYLERKAELAAKLGEARERQQRGDGGS
jgi:hypothetical protein